MKNLFVIAALAGMFALVSCGGSKKDDEKAKQDSIRKADSLAKVAEDSIKKVEELEQARLDSIAKAKEDSIANASKGTYKPKTNTTTVSTNTTTITTNTTKPVRGGR
ncbi:MAG: hypothetical protein A2W93_14560 [Bacteroidetes bacterium GWF2_43_63]|nr:MAG: hypothetical protein A2W94_01130 [Bacteroidetes bacterium GWE2_42_42]OFY52563.1 MAG: hypothetical protein A2W93_14560 [Bacteroidetes bacterium GWF2_43_63]HBG71470.1 hypothetical protein [Bacteroidales bacterium]HCB60778.1 hypothetical protein [Bacteroidales bacterium]HCY23497.1 hypothetical protein [Bacteroidales bacterium]